MNRSSYFRVFCVVIGLVTAAPSSLARDLSFYLGAAGGYSDLDLKKSNVQAIDIDDIDDSSAGWKIFFGLTQPFEGNSLRGDLGFEFAYLDLGEAEATAVPNAAQPINRFKADFEAYGVSMKLGLRPSERVSVYGKLGWFFGETDSDPSSRPGIALSGFTGDDSDDGIHYGFGLSYEVLDRLDLRVDWDRYDIFNFRIFGIGEDSSPDFFSVGIQYRF